MMHKRKPTIVSANVEAHQCCLELNIDADITDFQGHFADFPLLPGVTQIEWVMEYAQHYLAVEGLFLGMEVMKFQEPIRPKDNVSLVIEWQADKHKLVFKYYSKQAHEDVVYSSGKIKIGVASE